MANLIMCFMMFFFYSINAGHTEMRPDPNRKMLETELDAGFESEHERILSAVR